MRRRDDRTRGVRQLRWPNACSMSRENANGCLPRTRDRVTVAPCPTPRPPSRAAANRPRPAHRPSAPGARVHRRRRPGEQGYPPSVREIGEAVGLSSPSTVHAHLAALQDKGYLRRDPSKPRAIEVALEPSTGTVDRPPAGAQRPAPRRRRRRHRRARGRERRRGHPRPRPTSCGDGDLFMLRVRGESMIDAGIFDGDYVVVPLAADRRQRRHRRRGHPRRRSHGEDVPAQAQQDRAAAVEPDDGRPRLRPDRRRRSTASSSP